MKPRTTKTKEKALLAIALSVGALGGSTATNLNEKEVLTIEKVIEQQVEKQKGGGEFEQILKGGNKPSDVIDKETVKDFPENTWVDIYDGPKGKGYTVVTEVGNKQIRIGYGPEAKERTQIVDLTEEVTATSATSTDKKQ